MSLETVLIAPIGSWLWSTFTGKIADQTGKIIDSTGKIIYQKIDWQHASELYRGEMQLLYGDMQIFGMNKPKPLVDIFTDVFLLDKPSSSRRIGINDFQSYSIDPGWDRYKAIDLVQKNERLLVLGKPGAGKSTFLKHLVLECTTGKLDAIPIFISLKAWADSGLELMHFMAQQFAICAFPNAIPFINQILNEGRALVLFDGLDEVNFEQGIRDKITNSVRDFSNQYTRSRCIITCRTAANEYQFERFVYCELADFNLDQMITLVTQWFGENKEKRNLFLADFQKDENYRLRDLGRTPLLLTLLCLMFDDTMEFPSRRAELYQEAIDALLKRWDSSRNIKRTPYQSLTLIQKQQMLSHIASETFDNGQLFIHELDLANKIIDYIQNLPIAKNMGEIDGVGIIKSIEAQHGLIIERSYRVYSFSHLTFHEYFASRFFADHPSDYTFNRIIGHAWDNRWHEVLALTISMLDKYNAEIFFASFYRVLRNLINNNAELYPFIAWMREKSFIDSSYDNILTRMIYLKIFVITSVLYEFLNTHVIFFKLSLDIIEDATKSKKIPYYKDDTKSVLEDLSISNKKIILLAKSIICDMATNKSDIYTENIMRSAIRFGRELERVSMLPYVTKLDIVPLIQTLSKVSNIKFDSFIANVSPEIITSRSLTGVLLWSRMFATNEVRNTVDLEYTRLKQIWSEAVKNNPSIFSKKLPLLKFPRKNARSETWNKFESDLWKILVSNGVISEIGLYDIRSFYNYLNANEIFMECLNLANVFGRDYIRSNNF